MKLVQSLKRRMSSESQSSASSASIPIANPAPVSQAQTSDQLSPRLKIEEMQQLPLLTQASDKPGLLIQKSQLCDYLCDFSSPTAHIKQKEIKQTTLSEIIEFLSANTQQARIVLCNEQVLSSIVSMIGINLFRPVGAGASSGNSAMGGGPGGLRVNGDEDDEQNTFDLNWPHLQLVYELLLRMVISPDLDPKQAKQYINSDFLVKLLDLFNSEDPREREYLKTILHRLYGKFMIHRAFIRKAIKDLFLKVTYELDSFNGISELLEILGSIINGFALPLKDEHKVFLNRVLIPLHKVKTLAQFHGQLLYCITQYIEKDGKLSMTVIKGLLKFWPKTNSAKEVLFLNELEEILELTSIDNFIQIAESVYRQLAISLTSPNFQVAERSLFYWNNDNIVRLFCGSNGIGIVGSRELLYEIMVPALLNNIKNHWNNSVHGLSYNVMKILMETDSNLFERIQYKQQVWEQIVNQSTMNTQY
jgi:serine/threonine-protein phosphatase 2A regulatory subunit B'